MSLPRYPEYKDSGVSWLGEVPVHWSINPIKRNFMVVGGSTPKSDVPAYWDGDIVWVSPADLSRLSSNYVNNSARRITQLGLESCGTTLVPPGSIVLSTRAPIGSLGIADVELCTNQGCKSLVPVAGMKSQFTAYALLSATTQLNLRGKGTTFLELSSDELGAFPIPKPPLSEQAAIEVFLDRETAKIDALIAEQEKLIALLAEKRQATISRAVTRGLDPNVPLKDTGVPWLDKVPAHWEVVPLKYLVTLRSGGTPSKENLEYWNGEVPWASAKDMKLEELYDTEDHITEKALETGAACTVPAGSVLVVVRGMILARLFPVCQVMTPMAINQDLKAVLPGERLSADFLSWLLRGSAQESLRRLDEAGHGTKALRMDAWTSMQLPVPPLAEQRVIAEKLRHKLKLLAMLSEEAVNSVNILKERRAALISAAVTGKIDVRGLAA